MLPWALEVLVNVAITSTAQGPTHVLVQQLQTCWLHFFPTHTPWELPDLHITLSRLSHIYLYEELTT